MMRELAIIMAFGLLAIAPTTGRADEPPPDPLELLKGVEQDRLAIESGRVELEFRSSRIGRFGRAWSASSTGRSCDSKTVGWPSTSIKLTKGRSTPR